MRLQPARPELDSRSGSRWCPGGWLQIKVHKCASVQKESPPLHPTSLLKDLTGSRKPGEDGDTEDLHVKQSERTEKEYKPSSEVMTPEVTST